jgi:hypothetical protein
MEHEVDTLMDRIQRGTKATGTRTDVIRQTLLRDRAANIGGVCGNCVHFEGCTYPKAVTDTWFCEEYEFETAEELAPQGELVVLNDKAEEMLGLCSNCELKESCAFPKPAGGVWFCGEYQ